MRYQAVQKYNGQVFYGIIHSVRTQNFRNIRRTYLMNDPYL